MKWSFILLMALVLIWVSAPDLSKPRGNPELDALRRKWKAAKTDPGAAGPPRPAGRVERQQGWGRFEPFRSLFKFEADYKVGHVAFLQSQPIALPTGRLVGSDASITYGEPYRRTVPSGRFRMGALVETTSSTEGTFDTALAGAIFYSDRPVTGWIAATWPSSVDERNLEQAGCYPVDAARGSLFDAGAYYRYDEAMNDDKQRSLIHGWFEDYGAFLPLTGFGGGGAIFNPQSDGCYSTFFGLTADGSIAIAVTDFTHAFRPTAQ